MSDLFIKFTCEQNACNDLSVNCGDLKMGGDLSTAIAMSLFTDARAKVNDILPSNNTDKRGWWGFALDNEQFGSRLWLLDGANATNENLTKAKKYAEEALKWLQSDGVVSKIVVSCDYAGCCDKQLNINVDVCKPNGDNIRWRWRYAWDLQEVTECQPQNFDC